MSELIGKTVAVHYNFKAHKLSIREIHPVTGKLTRLLGLFNEISLVDAVFTCDQAKWGKWVSGSNLRTRQFAEIRGQIAAVGAQVTPEGCRVLFAPRQRPDFHLESGATIKSAPTAAIMGREIYVPVFLTN